MNCAVVANRVDLHARLFQFSGICFPLVAKWVVLGGDDKRGWQALELVDT